MSTAKQILALAAAMTVAMIAPAHAYLDPGTGSIVLQAIIGGVAASLFIFRSYFDRLKGWLGLLPNTADKNARSGDD
ncbi:MAG TPA: hypothetical protein VFY21_14785 [Xanthobacteraceae bacterium]|nr:hypothetical protein [Xanthobacteraceae bacterium]